MNRKVGSWLTGPAAGQLHVVAYNLVTLKEQLDRFRTLTSDHFVVRMEAQRSRDLRSSGLGVAWRPLTRSLCPKYDVELERDRPTSKSFHGSRTLPFARSVCLAGSGYLGVCFGQLITANSPASQGASPTNWQSVLWHEFCHVVTLQKTAESYAPLVERRHLGVRRATAGSRLGPGHERRRIDR